ncbi:MAG: hypothetical protein I8H91_00225 [Burkholderiales bacterium]|nr:hypothetical protein [Burkholderiales bacterium]MBH2018004.1 hypothetical protein [Burkholderiales bacterium]
MQKLQTSPPKQVLLRLPEDVAEKLARAVPPRQRNKFLVDLVRQELEKEDAELVAACEAMNAIEMAHPELLAETQEWLDADLTGSVDDWDPDFDRATFEREFAIAQAQLAANAATAKSRK